MRTGEDKRGQFEDLTLPERVTEAARIDQIGLKLFTFVPMLVRYYHLQGDFVGSPAIVHIAARRVAASTLDINNRAR